MSIGSFQAPGEDLRRGVRLVAARRLRGLSQKAAAAEIGCSRITLSGWENGKPIDEVWVEHIVRVYGGSKGWVRYGEGQAPVGYTEPDVVLAQPLVAHDKPAEDKAANKEEEEA